MAQLWTSCTVVVALVSSCSLPAFEHEGEHVVVATDLVDQVCAGTMERLDREVEHIDEQLGLPRTSERVRVVILDGPETSRTCGFSEGCSARIDGELYAVLSGWDFERVAVHELAHTRLGRRRSGSVALFSEGVAVAVSPAICPEVAEATVDQILAVDSGSELRGVAGGYYAGGELVAWLLDVHGRERVTAFLVGLQRPDVLSLHADPEFVRASYRSFFGTELDDDLHAHDRDPELMPPEALGCVAPLAPRDADRIHLEADLDCNSPRVQNDFVLPDRAFVDWTLTVPEAAAPHRYRLLDTVPRGTTLRLTRCVCDLHDARASALWTDETPVGASVELKPGSYRIRWRGYIDEDAELDIGIGIETADG